MTENLKLYRGIIKMNKYEFTGEVIELYGATLRRIRALKDFSDVRTGDLGGYIQWEANLSQKDKCWVYDNAWVHEGARVFDNAKVKDIAVVSSRARVFGSATVSGSASISGNANVYGKSLVSESAWVKGSAQIFDNAEIYGSAKVLGNAQVYDNAKLGGKVSIIGDAQVFKDICTDDSESVYIARYVDPDATTLSFFNTEKEFIVTENENIYSLQDYISKVHSDHGFTDLTEAYMTAVNLAKDKFAIYTD